MNDFWQFVILILLIYAVIYTILNRICNCIEWTGLAKRGFFDDIEAEDISDPENPEGQNPGNKEEK